MITAVLVISIILDIVSLCMLHYERSNRRVLFKVIAVLTVISMLAKIQAWIIPGGQSSYFYLNRETDIFIAAAVSVAIFAFLSLYLYAKKHMPLKSDMKVSLCELNREIIESIPKDRTFVIETEKLYMIFPQYTDVKLAFSSSDAERNPDITFWGSGPYKRGPLHNDIHSVIGPFLIDGKYYDSGLRAGLMLLGAFIRTENGFHFYSPQDRDAAFQAASGEPGSYGFSSNLLILDGKPRFFIRTYTTVNCFRVLGDYYGRLCIIDSKATIRSNDYFDEINKIGLNNAIAMDMGSYSNYSWYIDSNGHKTHCCHRLFNKSAVVLNFVKGHPET